MTVRVRERSGYGIDTAPSSSSNSTSDGLPPPPIDYRRLHDAPEYTRFLATVGRRPTNERREDAGGAERSVAVASRRTDAETRTRLDEFRAAFSGPYTVEGREVQARPMFRMNGGANEGRRRFHEGELAAICKKAKVADVAVYDAKVGRPTPDQLRQVTQALIDAGNLPPGPDDTCELRIRQMQWEWGVGVDCAGYSEQAARAARREAPRAPSHGDVFSGLKNDPTMHKVDVADIRPGDVIHLDPPTPQDVGHNVVVYAHHLASRDESAALVAKGGERAREFLRGPGPFHVLQVDSSWGAGLEGADYGGFRRDTWLLDEKARTWGFFDSGTGNFARSVVGPHDEPYTGAFRPKR